MANININDLTPALPIHPGDHLDDELTARKINLKVFANQSGIPFEDLLAITIGVQDVTADVALKIGKALNIEPAYWLNLQANYDKDKKKTAVLLLASECKFNKVFSAKMQGSLCACLVNAMQAKGIEVTEAMTHGFLDAAGLFVENIMADPEFYAK